MTEDLQPTPLEQLDAREHARLEQVEAVVASAFEAERPATSWELRARVRAQLGDVESALIRAAVLRLLNANRLHDASTAGGTTRPPAADRAR